MVSWKVKGFEENWVILFTSESMPIVEVHWPIQSSSLRPAELKKQRSAKHIWLVLYSHWVSEFSKIKLTSVDILRVVSLLHLLSTCWCWSFIFPCTTHNCVPAWLVFPRGIYRKGQFILLKKRSCEMLSQVTKDIWDFYCKVRWRLTCMGTCRLFLMLVRIPKCF